MTDAGERRATVFALCQNGCGLRLIADLVPDDNDPPGLCDKCSGQTCNCDSCLAEPEAHAPYDEVLFHTTMRGWVMGRAFRAIASGSPNAEKGGKPIRSATLWALERRGLLVNTSSGPVLTQFGRLVWSWCANWPEYRDLPSAKAVRP